MADLNCTNCGKQATEVTRIGYLCKGCFKYLAESCDFCCDTNPAWTYPVSAKFMLTPESCNSGDWLACQSCHDLIEAGNWSAVLNRLLKNYGDLEPGELAITRMVVSDLHRKFRRYLEGAPVRMGSA